MLDLTYYLGNAQALIMLALGLAAFALEVYALVDALRYQPQAYQAAGKLTKPGWVAILAVAVAVGFVTIGNVLGIGVLGVVAAGVYLADVRPALRAISPRRKSGRKGGQGPYGSW